MGPLHDKKRLDVLHREDGLGHDDINERSQLFPGILLFDGVADDAFLHIVAHHGGGELHPGEGPETTIDILDGLIQIQPDLRQLGIAGQGKACGAAGHPAVDFLIHGVSIAHF